MQRAGLVRRWKLEPFSLTRAEHGIEAVPDALFELHDHRVFVLENKAARFLTDAKEDKARHVERVINGAGLTYLFWTDAWPLTPTVWRQVKETRRCGAANIGNEQLLAVAAAVMDEVLDLKALRVRGLYRPIVLASVWLGLTHLTLFSPITEETLVSSNPLARGFDLVLHAPVAAQRWWTCQPSS
jgi:hypothetical protein